LKSILIFFGLVT